MSRIKYVESQISFSPPQSRDLVVDLLVVELIFLMYKGIKFQMFPPGTLPSSGLMPISESSFDK